MRISSLDRQIIAAERAVDDALRRRDTRGSHHAINHLRALRTKRLRREVRRAAILAWLAPFGRIVATLAFFALAAALYTVATIEEAQAATAINAGPSAMEIAAIWAFVILVLTGVYLRAMNAMDRIDDDNE